MKTPFAVALGLIIGGCLSALIITLQQPNTKSASQPADQPLYWVAPMDPNYRRDQPGKSPMGMDLVPVYAENTTQQSTPGTITIAPNVVQNLGVRTSRVLKQNLHVPINTVGYVGYNQDTLVHIHPRVEGWIETLYVKTSGQKVEKGEPLYALYSPQLVNAQEEYLLAHKRNNQALIQASYERLKALQMPTSSIQQLAKNAQVQQTVVFTAPQSGVVDNLNIREGFYVKPGTTLLSIGALDEVWVEAEVFERQASQVKADLKVTMTLGFLPGETWQGKLDYIYPTLDPLTRTVRVRVRFANPQRKLKPNMFAQITIHSEMDENALVIPKEAVIRSGKQDRVVLALGQGQFKSVAVELGVITAEQIQILSGLNEGDEVVTSAQFLLDSESSISSDFQRMSVNDSTAMNHSDNHQDHMAAVDEVQHATVMGTLLAIDSQKRILTIHRDAIEKWQRPAATMDFTVQDGIDLDELALQDTLHFTFEIGDEGFVIVSLMQMNMPISEPVMGEHDHD